MEHAIIIIIHVHKKTLSFALFVMGLASSYLFYSTLGQKPSEIIFQPKAEKMKIWPVLRGGRRGIVKMGIESTPL